MIKNSIYWCENKYATTIGINLFAEAGHWGDFADELVLEFALGVVPQNRSVEVPVVDAVLFDASDGAVTGRLAVVPRCEVERLPRLAPVEFAFLREIAAAYPHPVRNGGTCEKTLIEI